MLMDVHRYLIHREYLLCAINSFMLPTTIVVENVSVYAFELHSGYSFRPLFVTRTTTAETLQNDFVEI